MLSDPFYSGHKPDAQEIPSTAVDGCFQILSTADTNPTPICSNSLTAIQSRNRLPSPRKFAFSNSFNPVETELLTGPVEDLFMRKKTLATVCFILSMVVVFLLKYLASSQGITLPLIGDVSHPLASFIIVPLLLILLTALNKYVLAWRKARGRDIEEEEKHEFDEADIISLRPRQSHEHPSTYRK